jgi:hypothetical protein
MARSSLEEVLIHFLQESTLFLREDLGLTLPLELALNPREALLNNPLQEQGLKPLEGLLPNLPQELAQTSPEEPASRSVEELVSRMAEGLASKGRWIRSDFGLKAKCQLRWVLSKGSKVGSRLLIQTICERRALDWEVVW